MRFVRPLLFGKTQIQLKTRANLSPPKKKNRDKPISAKIPTKYIIGMSPSYDRIGLVRALNDGVDLAKLTNVSLEFGEGAAEAWLDHSQT
jgi:hypothetical protein